MWMLSYSTTQLQLYLWIICTLNPYGDMLTEKRFLTVFTQITFLLNKYNSWLIPYQKMQWSWFNLEHFDWTCVCHTRQGSCCFSLISTCSSSNKLYRELISTSTTGHLPSSIVLLRSMKAWHLIAFQTTLNLLGVSLINYLIQVLLTYFDFQSGSFRVESLWTGSLWYYMLQML